MARRHGSLLGRPRALLVALVSLVATLALLAASTSVARAQAPPAAPAPPPPALVPPKATSLPQVPYPSGASGDAVVVVELLVDAFGGVATAKIVDGPEPFAAAALALFVTIYVSAQIDATGKAFGSFLGWNYYAGALLGFGIVVVYTLSGGFVASLVVVAVDAHHGRRRGSVSHRRRLPLRQPPSLFTRKRLQRGHHPRPRVGIEASAGEQRHADLVRLVLHRPAVR